jgi:hypothetical protein
MAAVSDPSASLEGAAAVTQFDATELYEHTDHTGVVADSEIVQADVEAALHEAAEAAMAQAEADAHPGLVPPLPLAGTIPIAKRAVQGRYRFSGAVQLELRVDVEGRRPLNQLSGDFFSTTGGTTAYFGSFRVMAPTVTKTASEVRIEGLGAFTWSAAFPKVRVTIPRVLIFAANQPATLQFLSASGVAGAAYICPFVAGRLRSVELEQDFVKGTVPFVSYNTGSLTQPAGSPARTLTVPGAYGEAGIELVPSGTINEIPLAAAGAGAAPAWSDSELHNAMVNHFSLHRNAPQWKVWMLVATSHEGGYRGIMFDYAGANQRQGAAVFYDAIKGTDAASQRAMLRTYVHELGHAFNLLHSWDKAGADPPQPLGPNGGLGDLSWMNYAWKYQPPPPGAGGEGAYWAAFPFQFTDNELAHLRHGRYRNVIMGGDAFATGAAEIDPGIFEEPAIDNSRLAVELRSDRTAFEYGEPVVVEVKLSTTDTRGCDTHGFIHPKDDFVRIAIRTPSGRVVGYRPLMPRCADEERKVRLDSDNPSIYASAYVGFGRDGHYFEQPGVYELRAQFVAADGSRIVSPVLKVRVRSPLTRADQQVGELLLGEQVGQLMYLLGSDSSQLREGNEALEAVIDRHSKHALAVYAKLVKGINCTRDFKDISPEKSVSVRKGQPAEAAKLLADVEAGSKGADGVDNITLNSAMRRLARVQARAGQKAEAEASLKRLEATFEKKKLKPHVMRRIREQADATRRAIKEGTA